MNLFENPFFLFDVSTREEKKRILEIIDEKSLSVDFELCSQASTDLINPRKRLYFEIAWLPGVGPKRAKNIIQSVLSSPTEVSYFQGLPNLARANLISTVLLIHKGKLAKHEIECFVIDLANTYQAISSETVCSLINEERSVAKFPNVSDIRQVEEDLSERRRYYIKSIKESLDCLESMDLVKGITYIVENTTDSGFKHAPIIIDDLINMYEVEAQPFFEKENNNIQQLLSMLKEAASRKKPLSRILEKLDNVVRNWDTIAQPIQLSCRSRGVNHLASQQLANSLRSLSIDLYNNHELIELSQQLNELIGEVFAEVTKVIDRYEDDAEKLADIKKQKDKWEQAISFTTKDDSKYPPQKFQISPSGIHYGDKKMPLESIVSLRWGGTTYYKGPLPVRSEYTFFYGDGKTIFKLQLVNQDVFNKLLDVVWKAIGFRIMDSFLKKMREGKSVTFGNIKVNDQGLYLPMMALFSVSQDVYCKWNELAIWNEPGSFCIGKKNNKKIVSKLSYLDTNNVHILEMAIRTLWKTGEETISSIMDG